MTRVVLVPGVLALLPEYAGIEDPVAELRAACLSAVSWLGSSEVTVLADPQGARVAEYLLEVVSVSTRSLALAAQPPGVGDSGRSGAEAAGVSRQALEGLPQPSEGADAAYLVVGNGSARRTEKAPGFLDERAATFDAELGERLRAGRFEVDEGLAAELLASVSGIAELGRLVSDVGPARVDYDDDPYGVQYWVMRWSS